MIRIDHVTFSYGEESESAGGVQDINNLLYFAAKAAVGKQQLPA